MALVQNVTFQQGQGQNVFIWHEILEQSQKSRLLSSDVNTFTTPVIYCRVGV